LAKRAGADPARVRDALKGGFADSRILEVHGQRMIDHAFTPGAKATTQRKDMDQAIELATELGLTMPATALSRDLYDKLIESRNIAGLPLVDAQASFRGRCRWTDDVEIESFISRFGSKSFTVTHNVWNDGEIAVEGTEIRIWGLFDPEDDTKLKAGVIPDDFKKTFG